MTTKLCDICHDRPAEVFMWHEIESSTNPDLFKPGERNYEGMICRPCMERMQEQSRREQEEMTDEQRKLIEQMKAYAERRNRGEVE